MFQGKEILRFYLIAHTTSLESPQPRPFSQAKRPILTELTLDRARPSTSTAT